MERYIETFKDKHILITGGVGFIGSTIAIRLAGIAASITLVDSLIEDYGGNLFNIEPVKDKVNVNIADVRDEASMNALVKGKDYIFNMAGTLSHIDSMTNPYQDLEINCRSQLTILEACRKHNRSVKIVYAGTRGEYGKTCKVPVDETHPLLPTDVNGINKIAGELYHLVYNNVYEGISCTSLRLTNTFGPRHQMRHSKQGYLNWFIRLAMEDKPITIYDQGTPKRDFSYIDDTVESIIIACASEDTNGRFYNIGSGRGVSILESAQAVINAVGSGRIEHVTYPPDKKVIEVGDYIADASKFSNQFGWSPKVTFEEGLAKTVEYYRQYRENYW
ncbi:MAG: NAD-dependent epimerase/dehydratase family protein [Candidatus Auribacterota bacterium]|jgi:nucleoside-diphosphate-sugar epimerase|nr:NAD-dependent epimerase/dehydratase family protein [Candidatus Auribacterota bacterium]